MIGEGGIPSDAELFDAFNYYNPWIILGEAMFGRQFEIKR